MGRQYSIRPWVTEPPPGRRAARGQIRDACGMWAVGTRPSTMARIKTDSPAGHMMGEGRTIAGELGCVRMGTPSDDGSNG